MKTISDNRKARFNYNLMDEYDAGIVLTGCEIKSVRQGNVNMGDSYCYISRGEVWVKNLHISEYKDSGFMKNDPMRDRKLLLNRQEIRKIESRVKAKGVTVVPTRMYINDKGLCKMTIALATGKKDYDKRETIKERDIKRQMRDIR